MREGASTTFSAPAPPRCESTGAVLPGLWLAAESNKHCWKGEGRPSLSRRRGAHRALSLALHFPGARRGGAWWGGGGPLHRRGAVRCGDGPMWAQSLHRCAQSGPLFAAPRTAQSSLHEAAFDSTRHGSARQQTTLDETRGEETKRKERARSRRSLTGSFPYSWCNPCAPRVTPRPTPIDGDGGYMTPFGSSVHRPHSPDFFLPF